MKLNETLTDRVYKQIKTSIINLEVDFGQKIKIKELSDKHNISLTPIRESLNLLVRDGLVVYKPRQGYYIVDLSVHDIEEIFEMRELIECFSIKKGILEGIFKKDYYKDLFEKSERIKRGTHKEKEIIDFNIFLGRELHLNIVKSSSNSKLYNFYLKIYPFVNISQNLFKLNEVSLDEHIYIIKLIIDNDLKAIEVLRNHLQKGKERILNAFKKNLI